MLVSPSLRVASPSWRRLRSWKRTALPGRSARLAMPRASISAWAGMRSGFHGSSKSVGADTDGSSSSIMLIISAPDAPSIVAWWSFVSTAKSPLSRPSIT